LLEAHDNDGQEFGTKRILEEGLSLRQSDAGVILDGLFARVREFGGRVFEDDATVVVLAVSAIAGEQAAAETHRNRPGTKR
jgi:serine phosphatase RsbU (regulator of sigma subunit)